MKVNPLSKNRPALAALAAGICLPLTAGFSRAQSDPISGDDITAGDTGSSGAASADEIAKKLANPNTPLASLTLKTQFRSFEGTLPGANDQESYTSLFQPSFPFPLGDDGSLILFRPAIPIHWDQPVFNPAKGKFDSEFGLGDIAFDLAYAKTEKNGLLWAGGIISTLPTATTDGLGGNNWTLGPEILVGTITEDYVLGLFPNHQWDIAGSGNDVNLTTIQAFATWLPGGGWNVGTSPLMTYNWESEDWTIPVNLSVGKTVILGDTPWKISLEANYYVDKPGAFAPEWMIGISFAPVVENVFARWFK